MTEYFNVLKNSRLFTGMTAEDIDSLLKCISPEKREYKKNEYIWRQGEKTERKTAGPQPELNFDKL